MRWLILMLCLASWAAAAETYRWVDENGVVNYSDTPHPGAEIVDLRGIPTTRFAQPPTESSMQGSAEASSQAATGSGLESVTIQRPQPEETLWNLEGQLDVQVSVEPTMRSDYRLRLYLDGTEVVGIPAGATSFTIDRVFRGMHTLRASVQDENGRQIGGSEPVRFYVRQTSVQNPQRPLPPRPTPRPRG